VVSLAGAGREAGEEQQFESHQWTYRSMLPRSSFTRRDELIEHTSESIRADLEKFEGGQPCRMGRRRRSWSRSSSRAAI